MKYAWDIKRMQAQAAIRAARKCEDCGEPIPTRGRNAKTCERCSKARNSYAANREAKRAASRLRDTKPERIAYLKMLRVSRRTERNAYRKAYGVKNKVAISVSRTMARLAKYGVPEADRQRLLDQKTCDCCGVIAIACAPRFMRALVVDHDHATGKFRGMLCVHCNCMVGYAKEDAARLRAGANYVERNQNMKVAA